MADHLQKWTGRGQIAETSPTGVAAMFTAAGRLERATSKAAGEIAASTYLNALRVEGQSAIERAKVSGGVALEREGTLGVARLGNEISNELAHSSGLAHQLVAEVLTGTSGRIQQLLNDGARRIGNA